MSPSGLELVEVGFDEDGLVVVSDLLFATQPEWDRSVPQILAALPLDPEQRRVVSWPRDWGRAARLVSAGHARTRQGVAARAVQWRAA
jgi:hypothetical protein